MDVHFFHDYTVSAGTDQAPSGLTSLLGGAGSLTSKPSRPAKFNGIPSKLHKLRVPLRILIRLDTKVSESTGKQLRSDLGTMLNQLIKILLS